MQKARIRGAMTEHESSPAKPAAKSVALPPAFLVRAVLGLRAFFLRVADRVVPAQLALGDQIIGLGRTHALRAAVRFGIADRLASGPQTAAALAAEIGVDADTLHRLLRALAAARILRLDRQGRFHNTRLSVALCRGAARSMADFAEYFGSASNAAAWVDFEATVRTGANAFERVHGMSIWDWLERHPDERSTFAGAMASLTELEAPILAKLYPFGELECLCDVGGGRGTLLAAVLGRHPRLRAVLFESAGVLEVARPYLAGHGVLERVELSPGCFFETIPSGCDAYLLKNILHDWDDERCRSILGRCRAAMSPRAGPQRLLVIEELVERNATTGTGPFADLQMMTVCCEGRERSREEYAALFESSGFALRRVFGIGAGSSVIEGVAK